MEHWERIIELEIDYYLNVQKYENELLERYHESQVIPIPSTLFLGDEGRMYMAGRSTEDQALYRLSMKAHFEKLLKQMINRVNRLGRALKHLTENEVDVISIYYLEDCRLSDLQMARSVGFRTAKNFLKEKDRVLRKLYDWYMQDREQTIQEGKQLAKEKPQNKSDLLKQLCRGK